MKNHNTFDPSTCTIGIEFGSTQVKAVLIDDGYQPLASGKHTWESRLENGNWTYPIEDVWHSVQSCFSKLQKEVADKYGSPLHTVGAIGISAMMHGYLPFDKDDRLLTPFRTWRNTTTEKAASELTGLFGFNIPQRWTIAHLYQAMLNGEEHVKRIDRLDTLASYVHRSLTGSAVTGIGDASGIFPVDSDTLYYDRKMMDKFLPLAADMPWEFEKLLPTPLPAGKLAGTLTEKGARLLDPTGALQPGIPFCPPEGDAQTGMTATNAVSPRTGNVSAGTSIFSMIVLEKIPEHPHPEIDVVTTPDGKPVAMVHCSNCTSDMNAWVNILLQLLEMTGARADIDELYPALYRLSLKADADCGGVTVCNYMSGEHTTGFASGVPMVLRDPSKPMSLAEFTRAHLYSAMASLSLGMSILRAESVKVDKLVAHGGLFRTKGVGQRYLAAAMQTPVSVMETASVGGPYGMALLAAFMREKRTSLPDFLNYRVFADAESSVMYPNDDDVAGFNAYLDRFKKMLEVEKTAVEKM